MNGNELHYARITDIAGLLERRELSPVELTRHMLDRISLLDRQLNSYQTVMALMLSVLIRYILAVRSR